MKSKSFQTNNEYSFEAEVEALLEAGTEDDAQPLGSDRSSGSEED